MQRLPFLFLILFTGQSSFGQVNFDRLEDVLKYADKYSITSTRSRILGEISRQEIKTQRSLLLPQVNFIADANYYPVINSLLVPDKMLGGNEEKLTRVQFGLPFTTSASVEGTMPILALEKRGQVKKAQLENVRTHFTEKAKLERLHIEVTQVYYEILVIIETIRLNQENKSITDELMRIFDNRKKEGILDPAEYNRAKILQLEIENTGIHNEGFLQEQLIKLRSLLNLPAASSIRFFETLPSFSWELPEIIPVARKAALQEANMKLAVANQSLDVTKKASFPKLSAFGRYSTNLHMRFGSQKQDIHFDASAVGVKIELPLFAGGSHKTQRSKNKLLIETAQADQQYVSNSLLNEHTSWMNGYHTALKKKTVLQKKVTLSADNLRIASAQLKEGILEFDQYNNIFLEYNKVKKEEINNLFNGMLYSALMKM